MLTKLLEGVAWRLGKEVIDKGSAARAAGDTYLARLCREFGIATVIDVGANEGQYAKRLREKSSYRGLICSFEPIPEVFQTLQKAAGYDGNWKAYPQAVDAKRGKGQFNVMVGSEFSSLLSPDVEHKGAFGGQNTIARTVEVDIISLGDAAALADGGDPTRQILLKLDTQGTELRILQTAGSVVHRFAAIQVEVSFAPIYEGAATFAEILDWMKENGFLLSSLFANNDGHFPRLLEMDAVFCRADMVTRYAL